MQRIRDFLKKQKYAIIWTACYFCVAYALFRILFGFDMLSYAQWARLANAQLRGFAGFVFGIMILTLLPLYASTTAIIVRTGAPLFTIPLPAFLKRAPAAAATTTDAPAPADTPAQRPLPDGLPIELRAAYLRARSNAGREQISSVDTRSVDTASNIPPAIDTKSAIAEIIAPTMQPTATAQPDTATSDNGALPLPTDFDLGDDFDDAGIDSNIAEMAAPVFTEINFDDAPTDTVTATAPTPNASITEYMHDHNIKIVATDGDILITDKLAIAVHDDPNFWVAEDENWFAAGSQKVSPVLELIRAAEKHNVKPVLYMGATNIMDFDQMREKWTAAGITVITRPDELPE
ncbi:MAG: hypothetical protein Q4E56_04230 [Pseudomonadota bacterium]|nr:hypothetical protein [Pseudomonadota bacterium]